MINTAQLGFDLSSSGEEVLLAEKDFIKRETKCLTRLQESCDSLAQSKTFIPVIKALCKYDKYGKLNLA